MHYGQYIDITIGTFQLEGDSRLLQYFTNVDWEAVHLVDMV